MKLVIQRVSEARVVVNERPVAAIGKGMLVLVGFKQGDTSASLTAWAKKMVNLRMFDDGTKAINNDITSMGGEILIVSQFTLYGDCSHGNRPSFVTALAYDEAEVLFDLFVQEVKKLYPKVQTGIFGAEMLVSLSNDGPVTLIIGE